MLLDFFAYSCINCQRDQPYIERWYETYHSLGLEVIGIHSPEFAFEKDAGNLASSLRKEGTTYPVVQDNDLKTWTAYRNRYWPAKYLIDGTGTVRAIKFGEGGYEQTESLIRSLLTANQPDVALPAPVTRSTRPRPGRPHPGDLPGTEQVRVRRHADVPEPDGERLHAHLVPAGQHVQPGRSVEGHPGVDHLDRRRVARPTALRRAQRLPRAVR